MVKGRRKHTIAEASPKKRAKILDLDYDIESSSDEEERSTPSIDDQEEEVVENLEAKKVRLAREYLERIDAAESSEDDDGASSSDDDEAALSRKLRKDRQLREGAYEKDYAKSLRESMDQLEKLVLQERPSLLAPEEAAKQWVSAGHVTYLSGHQLTPTCIDLNNTTCISGSKDHSVVLWDMEKQQKSAQLVKSWKKGDDDRNLGQVLSVALSDDSKYAAVGKRNRTVSIFDVRSNELVKVFSGHKGPVTSLCFQAQSLNLFSGSEDRCIRHFDLSEMMFLEVLYGHQNAVTAIGCHRNARPVSVSRDRTARAWKVSEDSHLIFRGGAKTQPADAVSVFKPDWFVTGHENGGLNLWNVGKKRPVVSMDRVHGGSEAVGGNAVVSLHALHNSNVLASGSHDGFLRLWEVTSDDKSIDAISAVPLHGYINGVRFSDKARFCVAAVGQEHRLGRWNRIPRAKNRVAVVRLHPPE